MCLSDCTVLANKFVYEHDELCLFSKNHALDQIECFGQ